MRRAWIAVVLLSILPACGLLERTPERELAWVANADADGMFERDARRGRIRFLVVCGISCLTPEVGWITYERCYRRHAGTNVVDPTGDVIMSAEHGRLKILAGTIASAYNRKALLFLDSTGLRDCSEREKWDELWHAMSRVADSVPRHPYHTSVIAYGARRDGAEFQLHVPDPVDLTDSLKMRICSLVPEHGIDSIRVRVTTGDINRGPVEAAPFGCIGGVVAA